MSSTTRRTILLIGLTATIAAAADWPQYRGDAARSSYTPEALPAELSLQWVRQARHAPRPAWKGRPWDPSRMWFDWAYHVAVKDGMLFFGSSADHKVYALDAASGRERWTFFTCGPVRFAPAAWQDRIFVVSDDGFLYCLATKDGTCLWKLRGGPDADLLVGNGRIVSRWVARGGPAVRDGVVYWAAGIWPTDRVFIYAVDATSGKVLWCNDGSGAVEMAQPHVATFARSGVAAQGYLAVTGKQVFVPTGRAVPAAFGREDGCFQYFHLSRYGGKIPNFLGGGDVVAADAVYLNSGFAVDAATGIPFHKIGKWRYWTGVKRDGRRVKGRSTRLEYPLVAVTPDGFVRAEGNIVCGCSLTRVTYETRREGSFNEKGKLLCVGSHMEKMENAPVLKDDWSVTVDHRIRSMVVADRSILLGGDGRVSMLDSALRKVTWSADVDGTAYGLAVAGERLYVSTDKGNIYCFGLGQIHSPAKTAVKTKPAYYPSPSPATRAADSILQKTGIKEGYCLDLGCRDGALAFELARRTDLTIIGIDPDPKNVARARSKLDSHGLYGTRVTILQGDPNDTHLPDYFANLIVSCSALWDGPDSLPEKEIARLQRPYGGVVCTGRSGALRASTRGALEGAGTWTHACADPGNTMNSGDTIVKAPLGMLWYEDETMPTVSRHGKGPAPLFCQGILLREGIDAMKAIDAYNGRTLWQVPLPGVVAYLDVDSSVGTAATGGTYCVADGVVYVRRDNYCLLLDVLTGKQIARLDAPKKPDGQPGTWTVIACKDGILFGALANEQYIIKSVHGLGYEKNQVPMNTMFTESSLLFALDAKTGAVKWTWQPEQSIRNNAIAIGSGRVFLIDRVPAEIDKILKSDVRERRGKKLPLPEHPTGVLVALDAETGKVLWRNPENIYGTTLSYSEKHDVLIMSYRGSWALPSEFARRSLGAFQGATGKWLWNIRPKRAAPRPIIHERTLYYFPHAYDLLTGKAKEDLAIQGKSFGCTPMMGSANLILTRSGTVSYYDLLYNCGWLEDYGGMRPGCWVNMLPVGGLVLIPDDTSGCRCSYLNQANVALKEYGVRPPLVLPKACSFKNKLTVTITHPDPSVEIRYTLDDSYPTVQSPLYTAPLTLTKTTTLRAAISQNGHKLSDRDAITYTKE